MIIKIHGDFGGILVFKNGKQATVYLGYAVDLLKKTGNWAVAVVSPLFLYSCHIISMNLIIKKEKAQRFNKQKKHLPASLSKEMFQFV